MYARNNPFFASPAWQLDYFSLFPLSTAIIASIRSRHIAMSSFISAHTIPHFNQYSPGYSAARSCRVPNNYNSSF